MTARRRWVVRAGEGGTVGEILQRAGAPEGAIGRGAVFVGRRRVADGAEPVTVGDEVIFSDGAGTGAGGEAVRVLAHEDGMVVVDKPAGIPTIADQSGAAHSLHDRLARTLGVPPARLHPTSRLDRDVSGVVIFTESKEAADRLVRAREEGAYARRYVALSSPPPDPFGTWDAPIGRAKDPKKRSAFGAEAVTARSRFAVVATSGAVALLVLEPETGRTHQLRVHASHAGAPLLGDVAYGGGRRLTLGSGRVVALGRIALHAARVAVPGANGSLRVYASAIPAELASLWSAAGGDAGAWADALDRPRL